MSRSHPPLLATCWTTAGDVAPLSDDETSPHDLLERIDAAAAVGYEGFGFLHADLRAARSRHSWSQIRDVLADSGIRHVEVEFLTDWFAVGAPRARSDEIRADLLEAAAELGARHLKVGGSFSDTWPDRGRAVAAFRRLCEDAEQHGTRVALEPMPFSSVPDLDAARRVVEDAAHPCGGLMLDIWHVARSGVPYSSIEQIPARHIVGVELDDADAEVLGELLEDTIHRRRLCGEGDLDVPAFIRAVTATGYEGPFGVEIISDEHRRLSLATQAARSFDTTREQFVGWSAIR